MYKQQKDKKNGTKVLESSKTKQKENLVEEEESSE